MRLHRFLKEENVDLHFTPLEVAHDPWMSSSVEAELEALDDEDEDEEDDALYGRALWKTKLRILEPLTHLLYAGGRISNRSKLFTDLRNREAKASTGLGQGFAMPHVRTPQAKDFVFGVAIAPAPGLWFDALDEQPVRIFFPMVMSVGSISARTMSLRSSATLRSAVSLKRSLTVTKRTWIGASQVGKAPAKCSIRKATKRSWVPSGARWMMYGRCSALSDPT